MWQNGVRPLPWGKLIKFGVVGGTALALDFGIYFLLTRFGHLPYLGSRAISIASAFAWNFTLNRYWTFKAHTGDVRRQATRFTITMVCTSLLNLGLMHVGVSILHGPDLLVILIVSALIMGINYLVHSLWSYR